jgi:putative phosphoesterase
MDKSALTIGVISDTHGQLRDEAFEALRGSDLIVHAGDVGSPRILQTLGGLAEVHAVRGNVDRERWADELPWSRVVQVDSLTLYVLHDLGELDLDPAVAGIHAVIYGHSHSPSVATRNGVLYLNPGSAGPRRFDLPVAVARLRAQEGKLTAEIVELPV